MSFSLIFWQYQSQIEEASKAEHAGIKVTFIWGKKWQQITSGVSSLQVSKIKAAAISLSFSRQLFTL